MLGIPTKKENGYPMRRSKFRIQSFLILSALVINTCLVSGAFAFDTTTPTVESCLITPHQVSDATGGTLRVTIKVVSKNGLTNEVLSVLNMKNSSTLRQLGGFIMRRESGDEFSGTWVQDIAVKPGLMPGIYALSIFPLEDKNQNRTSFLSCPGQDVFYGVAEPTPTPTPTPKSTFTSKPPITPAATPESLDAGEVLQLKSQVALLQTQLKTLQIRMKKICSVKPKPKGC